MDRSEFPPGAAQLQLADGVAVLRPTEAVFEAMLTGWSRQQLARNLSPGTIAARVSVIRRFQLFCGADGPWIWTPAQADDWVAELRGIDGAAHSTVLGYQGAIRQFMAYLTDPAYGWIPHGAWPATPILIGPGSAPTQPPSARSQSEKTSTSYLPTGTLISRSTTKPAPRTALTQVRDRRPRRCGRQHPAGQREKAALDAGSPLLRRATRARPLP